MILHAWPASALIATAHIAAALAGSIHALMNKRDGNSALLWMMLIWSFPFAGVCIYLLIGVDRIHRKSQRRSAAHAGFEEVCLQKSDAALSTSYWRTLRESGRSDPPGAWATTLNRSFEAIMPAFPLTDGNRTSLLETGDEAYPPMLEAIRAARHHIHVQMFIIAPDETAELFVRELAARAREGVKVRVLYDKFGCTPAVARGFIRRMRRISPGVEWWGWTQTNVLRRQFQLNLRNHRKLLLVDGRVAFTGGINLQNSNTTQPDRAADRDYMFRVEGPAVRELQFGFLSDWQFMTGATPTSLLTSDIFPAMEACGSDQLRVIHSGPSSDPDLLCDVLFNVFAMATRQILISTPYFVPTPDLQRALRSAALRGVQVKIMVPGKNNHLYVGWASRSFYQPLLDAGAQILERPMPFLHAKAIVVDDQLSLIGSANLDPRSLRLNYETTLAVFGSVFAGTMKESMLSEFVRCESISADAWRLRSSRRRFLEKLCALLAPEL